MKNDDVHKIAMGGVLAALILILTMLVSIPLPGGHGYINLGDAGVLVTAYMLGGVWGAVAAGVASALADILLGWTLYAPATLLIKGGMALIAAFLSGKLPGKRAFLAFYLSAPLVPLGYFFYECMLYGYAAAILNVPLNLVQCMAGAAVAHAVLLVIPKVKNSNEK